MNLSIIAAMDKNQLIGKKNKMPWYLPADLSYFKKLTSKHIIVMGRRTFESIGKPLKNRRNIVLTRNTDYSIDGCEIMHSIDEILNTFINSNEEIFIIGGAEIYKSFLPYVNRLYITKIDHEFEGDTFFPKIDWNKWKKTSEKNAIKDTDNPYTYSYHIYERIT
ncbi:dihydrofolate reductase [Orenia marismortui]|uniref:dihydrofolate reductase n=1 Tax=Orenia marismortui TaxID=46469 RepID=UPI000365E71C|nr:dihydrofolate reductase [Orenia marismortui]